jgi:hypothetical protein
MGGGCEEGAVSSQLSAITNNQETMTKQAPMTKIQAPKARSTNIEIRNKFKIINPKRGTIVGRKQSAVSRQDDRDLRLMIQDL